MCKGASPLPFLPPPLLPVPSPFVPPPWGKPGCAPEVAARQPRPPLAPAEPRQPAEGFCSPGVARRLVCRHRPMFRGWRRPAGVSFRFFRGVEARGDAFNLAPVCWSSKIL